MDIKKAARNTINAAGLKDTLPVRNDEGNTVEHALWMLHGITNGYIQHEKAHRWLGYAQAILVVREYIDLTTAKNCNRQA